MQAKPPSEMLVLGPSAHLCRAPKLADPIMGLVKPKSTGLVNFGSYNE